MFLNCNVLSVCAHNVMICKTFALIVTHSSSAVNDDVLVIDEVKNKDWLFKVT